MCRSNLRSSHRESPLVRPDCVLSLVSLCYRWGNEILVFERFFVCFVFNSGAQIESILSFPGLLLDADCLFPSLVVSVLCFC